MITAKYILATIAIVLGVINILTLIALIFNKKPSNKIVEKLLTFNLIFSPILSLAVLILDILITLIA